MVHNAFGRGLFYSFCTLCWVVALCQFANSAENDPQIDMGSSVSRLLSPLASGKSVAFVGVRNGKSQEDSIANLISQQLEPLIMAAAQDKGVVFLERASVKLIFEEWALNDLTDGSGDPGARNLLGADYLITGKLQPMGQNAYCTLKTIELQSGKVVSVNGGWTSSKIDQAVLLPATAKKNDPEAKTTSQNRGESSDGNLQVWTEKEAYAVGDKMIIHFTVATPSYVQLIDIDPAGKVTNLFPNPYQPDNFCYPGREYLVPSPDASFELEVTLPAGTDRIKAIASKVPISSQIMSKTRGISFTSKVIEAAPTRAQLTINITE